MDSARGPGRWDWRAVSIGALSGLVAILCCVSPVVLVLLGLASVSFAISLGNTLYYEYGWYFRAVGLVLGVVALYFYLRARRSCSLRGVRRYRWAILSTFVTMGLTYAALYALTSWLAEVFG